MWKLFNSFAGLLCALDDNWGIFDWKMAEEIINSGNDRIDK